MGTVTHVRKIDLMSEEAREFRQIVERRVRASGYACTQDDPIPIAVYERIMNASIAEYNAGLDAAGGGS